MDCLSAADKAFLFGVVFGGVGGLVGLLTGAIVRSRFVYEINGPTGATLRPVGPAGSVAGLTVTF